MVFMEAPHQYPRPGLVSLATDKPNRLGMRYTFLMKHSPKSTTHWSCPEKIQFSSCCGCNGHECKPGNKVKEVVAVWNSNLRRGMPMDSVNWFARELLEAVQAELWFVTADDDVYDKICEIIKSL